MTAAGLKDSGDWISNPTVLVGHGLRLFTSGAPCGPVLSHLQRWLVQKVWSPAWKSLGQGLARHGSPSDTAGLLPTAYWAHFP